MIRIAAISDLHISDAVPISLARQFVDLHQRADLLVVAGDLTENGTLEEAELAAGIFRHVSIPMIGVLGNHDSRAIEKPGVLEALQSSGIDFLDGTTRVLDFGMPVGFAGLTGSGGGFSEGETAMIVPGSRTRERLIRTRASEAARLDSALQSLPTQVKVVVTHYSPTTSTLGREEAARYPYLGNSELGRVIDRHRVDLAIHGHVHHGNASGRTTGGTPVQNVALTVTNGITIHHLIPRAAPYDPSDPIFRKKPA